MGIAAQSVRLSEALVGCVWRKGFREVAPPRIKNIGDLILEDYEVVNVWQSMALVYHIRHRDKRSEQLIAKCIRPDLARDRDIVSWFDREIQVWADVSRPPGHPHIARQIKMYVTDPEDGVHYMIIEYVEGDNLHHIVDRTRNRPGRRLSCPQTILWAAQIAAGMQYATVEEENRRGRFVHRDLDTTNVMVSKEGVAKVIDWGLGKNIQEGEIVLFSTRSLRDFRGLIGKPHCMPPELFPPLVGEDYGVSGDIYFFGGLLYEMLTGGFINPREKASLLVMTPRPLPQVCEILDEHHDSVILPRVEEIAPRSGLAELVRDCIAPDRQRRIDSFTTILERLAGLCDEVRAGRMGTDLVCCDTCSFIADEEQATCPVCGEKRSFKPWDAADFKVLIGDEEFAPATSAPPPTPPEPGPEGPPPDSLPPTIVGNELIAIERGRVTLGARADTVKRLVQEYGFSGRNVEKLSTPAEYTVDVAPYLIAKYTVSNGEYREFVEDTGWHAPSHWEEQGHASGRHNFDDLPVTHVQFQDVEAFCQWKGVRLPTDDEWERAARGAESLAYPWGNHWGEQEHDFKCNTRERHRATHEEVVSVSDFAEFASPDGLVNAAGNVWEWVDGGDEGNKHTRGGSWDFQGDIFSLLWFHMRTGIDVEHGDVGFRYAKDIEPRSERTPSDLEAMVTVSGGAYQIGVSARQLARLGEEFELTPSDSKKLAQNESRVARIGTTRMRKYLVTNEEYYEFTREKGYPWPEHWSREFLVWSDLPFPDRYRYHPVTHVSYRDALAFCSWRGGRLPTPEEWECAARGEDGRTYAWGDQFDKARCNCSETGLARTTRVDAYPRGASPAGCFDMTGNVQEWTATMESGRHFVRGGCFKHSGPLYGLTFLWIGADPEITAPDLGFRYVTK